MAAAAGGEVSGHAASYVLHTRRGHCGVRYVTARYRSILQRWSHMCNRGCLTVGSALLSRAEVVTDVTRAEDWVLLAYRLPREPSTPRSTVWRKLKRLGVAQLGDGLVALPADARTREALEWVAEEVVDNNGEAMLWLGRPADAAAQALIRERMNTAIAAEYQAVIVEALASRDSDAATRRRIAARLRRELHRIQARDFFESEQRAAAAGVVDELATRLPDRART